MKMNDIITELRSLCAKCDIKTQTTYVNRSGCFAAIFDDSRSPTDIVLEIVHQALVSDNWSKADLISLLETLGDAKVSGKVVYWTHLSTESDEGGQVCKVGPNEPYRINNNANDGGTSLAGYITCSYARLVELFGEPIESDGYKVSGEWIFTDTVTGDVFTVYDYKETSLYDDNYPTVAEFRAQPSYEWHIGAKDKQSANKFKSWLQSKITQVLSWLPDPSFREGGVWDLCMNGKPVPGCWWVASNTSGYVGNLGYTCNYTDTVPTMQEAAKLVLKAYNARQK